MFPSITQGLTAESRRNIIRSILPSMIEAGTSANKSLQSFRDKGLGIARSDFLNIFREVTGEEISSNRIRNVNKSKTPSDNVLGEMKYDTGTKYRFIGKASYYNDETGKSSEGYFGWDTDTMMTVEEIETQGQEFFTERYPEAGTNMVNFTISKGFINPNYT